MLKVKIAAMDLSIREKLEMNKFTKYVSKGNLDTPAKHNSDTTYRKYLNLFNEHRINLVTIPPKYKLDYLESLVKKAAL